MPAEQNLVRNLQTRVQGLGVFKTQLSAGVVAAVMAVAACSVKLLHQEQPRGTKTSPHCTQLLCTAASCCSPLRVQEGLVHLHRPRDHSRSTDYMLQNDSSVYGGS